MRKLGMEEGSPQAGGWSSLDVVMTTSRCTCMYRIREKKAIRYMYLISGGRVSSTCSVGGKEIETSEADYYPL